MEPLNSPGFATEVQVFINIVCKIVLPGAYKGRTPKKRESNKMNHTGKL